MTAVERLTKQNHDLEEQLRQRDAGHNIQEENQGDSSERGGPERPEGSNEPSRSERRNLSMPSLMDTALPPIFAEMQVMKEQMEVMMNALKGRASNDLDDLVNRIDSPFITSIKIGRASCRESPAHDLLWYSLEVHQGFEGFQMIE